MSQCERDVTAGRCLGAGDCAGCSAVRYPAWSAFRRPAEPGTGSRHAARKPRVWVDRVLLVGVVVGTGGFLVVLALMAL